MKGLDWHVGYASGSKLALTRWRGWKWCVRGLCVWWEGPGRSLEIGCGKGRVGQTSQCSGWETKSGSVWLGRLQEGEGHADPFYEGCGS